MHLRSLSAALLSIAPACSDAQLGASTVGDVALTEPGDTDTSGEPDIHTSDDDSDDDNDDGNDDDDGDDDDGVATSTVDAEAGDPPSNCDDDPACGPDEDVTSCPEQCSVCGDGVVSGDEDCDNGVNDSARHYYYKPSSIACAPGCRAVAWCGDGVVNGPEPCDDGHAQTADCELDCTIPRCGDRLVNPALDETCDDGNNDDDDGCTGDCAHVERRVFATSISVKGDINAGWPNPYPAVGLDLADARCNGLAASAKLSGVYKAWLSDASTSPSERFDTAFAGLYRLVAKAPDDSGPIVANGWSDLTDGTIAHPIDRDERGYHANHDLVWTNTHGDGTRASDLACDDWSEADPLSVTTLGNSSATTTWSNLKSDQTCAAAFRLYCFEDP